MKKSNKFKSILKVCFLLVCIISLVCVPFATNASAASYEPAKAPKINFFTASPTTVSADGTAILKWDVVNATKVDIKGVRLEEDEVLPLSGSTEVWPEATTTYVLVATGPGGEASASVTINVGAAVKAKVESFSASATEVVKGNSIVLSWKTSNAKIVNIIGIGKGDEILDLNGSLEVWPEETTTFLIRAVGVDGDIDSKSVTVNVVEGITPTINSFSASASEITLGDSTKLSWDVVNAKSIVIKDVKSGLAEKDTLAVTPTKTTTYVLEAVGTSGKVVSKSVTITVKEPVKKPIINSFTASDITVSKGTLVTLAWNTSNADGCMILTSDGSKLTNRPTTGKISVFPFKTKTYTLIIYNADKSIVVQKDITITVK